MTIKNIGQVFSSWKFIPKCDDLNISPSWLNFYPLKGILSPGEVRTKVDSEFFL